MKHILQWKMIGIMFLSLLCGITVLATSEYLCFGMLQGLTAEETEQLSYEYSYLFNLLFILVTIAVFLLLSRKIIKRIEVMNRNVEQIASGKLNELAVDPKKDELGNLSRHINSMAEQLANAIEKEREMVCTVAHDLRTPVTSIQGYARLVKKSPDLSKDLLDYITIIENKSVTLSEQIEELLEYSVLQFEEKQYAMESISLKRLIEQVFIEFVPMLEEKYMNFSIHGSTNELQFPCNQTLMVRLFENLLTNCIRYGETGGTIELQLTENESTLTIAISNYGSTLTSSDTEHLFEAFYQGNDAKAYQTKSKGLGLAIAQKIVSIHHGTIRVENDENRRKITFVIEFSRE